MYNSSKTLTSEVKIKWVLSLVIDIFLRNYLNKLGFKVSTKETEEAEFRFWSVFEDGTEPKPDPRNKGVGV